MKSILAIIHDCKQLLKIEGQTIQLPFKNYKDLPPKTRGVYIIEDDTLQPIYVGKGWIKDRQITHYNKALGIKDSQDTTGWRNLRENYTPSPDDWTLYYIQLHRETELTSLEGALIHLLQPLANDETYRDSRR